MSKKRKRREMARLKSLKQEEVEELEEKATPQEKKQSKKRKRTALQAFYEDKYKQLLLVPLILLILAFGQIGFQYATTGDFMTKGVSLKGGITVTVPDTQQDPIALETALTDQFPEQDLNVRTLTAAGSQTGLIINADILDEERSDEFVNAIVMQTETPRDTMSVETIGSSLGSSFFLQALFAILLSFLFMAFVVFLYFRIPIPSLAVILAAMSDIVITLAVVNIMDLKLSTAGIAAFLMLIGYSVDTDILLSTRVLKRKQGSIMDGIYSAMKTGLLMNFTTMAAIIVGLVLSESEVLRQIMIILFIGLIVDLINTWIQNAGILRWYLEERK